ncbi:MULTISPECIES: MFS transporter [Burkholderia]|uniref:MFS transporter n=1 Tax=Burkholderia paludis TaxID=1506587 RepID=A0A6P2PP65_9BURK|nr:MULTISPECIES: MFS transporter [Burkholderia]CAB3764698.1 Proline/betaine transporter [Burkholderia paludis]VWC09377.1 MFS transporter [Burkholderia paludis]
MKEDAVNPASALALDGHAAASRRPARSGALRDVAAAAAGNALEWFDFVIYGYFAGVIAKLFFPVAGPVGSLLLATATFGVGFVVRPLGSVVMGLYGDRYGRKAAMTLTIWLMLAGTAAIALAPPFAQAGWGGATILVLARLVQGFAASGEFGSTVAFLAEKAPPHRRHLFVSLQMASTMLAIVLGGTIGTILTTSLSPHQLESWGWRVPFAVGLLIGPVGYFIRRNVSETDAFVQADALPVAQVLGRLFGEHRASFAAAIGVTIVGTASFYMNLVYMPTFAVKQLGLPMSAPFMSTTVAGVVMVAAAPLAGLAGDVGRRPVALVAAAIVALAALTLPLYTWVIAHPSLGNLLIMQALAAVPMGVLVGLVPAITARVFPAEVRSTGLAVSYNIPTTVFGGFSPLIITWLIATTHNKASPALYIVAASVVSLVALLGFRRLPRA